MSSHKQRTAPRSQSALAMAWEQRTLLVKAQVTADRTASDVKTARLRALRLEKERLEAERALKAKTA